MFVDVMYIYIYIVIYIYHKYILNITLINDILTNLGAF